MKQELQRLEILSYLLLRNPMRLLSLCTYCDVVNEHAEMRLCLIQWRGVR